MTTLLNEKIETGDVIEMSRGDDVITALVLLAADRAEAEMEAVTNLVVQLDKPTKQVFP